MSQRLCGGSLGAKDGWLTTQDEEEMNRSREYTPFSAVSEHPTRVPNGQRDDNFLDTASRPGPGVLEEGREGQKYLGRGAGTLFVCEDADEVSQSANDNGQNLR